MSGTGATGSQPQPSDDTRCMQTVQRPVTLDPFTNTYYNTPTCFQRAVQHWQAYFNRAGTDDTRRIVIAEQNPMMLTFRDGTDVTCKLVDIQDHMGHQISYISPGDHVVVTLAIYTAADLEVGAAYNVSIGGALHRLRTPNGPVMYATIAELQKRSECATLHR